MTAPRKPCAQVHSECQPKLTTKSGIASGTTRSTAQARRPGRSVRSTHHAPAVPITAHNTVTATVSRTVFHSSDQVSGRKIRCKTSPNPAPLASISRKTSGRARTAATRQLRVSRATGRRARRGVTCSLRSPWSLRRSASVPAAAISASCRRRGSQQARLTEQGNRRRAVAEIGDRDRVGLKLGKRRFRSRGGHPGAERILIALLVPGGAADDFLALPADQEGEELLRRRLVLAVLQHRRAGDVDHV